MNIKELLGNNGHWQVNKKIARAIGIEPALLLAQLIDSYSHYENENMLIEYDEVLYFFETSQKIEENTSLSYKKQKTCIDILVENGFIKTKLKGIPAKLHFNISKENILLFFNLRIAETDTTVFTKSKYLNKQKGNTIYKENNINNIYKENNINILPQKAVLEKKEKTNLQKVNDMYFELHEREVGVKPNFTAVDAKKLKDLYEYFIKINGNDEKNALDSIRYIFVKFDTLTPFLRNVKPQAILSNISNIILHFKERNRKTEFIDFSQQAENYEKNKM